MGLKALMACQACLLICGNSSNAGELEIMLCPVEQSGIAIGIEVELSRYSYRYCSRAIVL